MKKYFKSLIVGVLKTIFPGLKNSASILMYHSVGQNSAFFTVKPEDFEWQMSYLRRRDFKLVKLSGLIEKILNHEPIAGHVVVTFDDGYRDNFKTVLPILKKYSIPATIFVPTGLVGKTYTTSDGITLPIINIDEMIEMQKTGLVEFMPHGVSHVMLHKMPIVDVSREIEDSKQFIEKITYAQKFIFSYPRGRFTPAVIEYLKNNKWIGAVSVEEGLVKPGDNLFTLKRNSVDSTTSRLQFKAKVSEAIGVYTFIRKCFTVKKYGEQ